MRPFASKVVRRWALALSAVALSFAGVLTAFGIAPDTATDKVERREVVEPLAFPAGLFAVDRSKLDQSQTYWREERVQRGDTLAAILARLRVDDAEVVSFLNTSPSARELFQLIPGRGLRAEARGDGTLVSLQLLVNERVVTVERDEQAQFTIMEHAAQLEARVVSTTGVIRSSFFAALDAAKIPDPIAKKLVEIFSTEIDFYRGLRANDRFSLVYEVLTDRGEVVGTGAPAGGGIHHPGPGTQSGLV